MIYKWIRCKNEKASKAPNKCPKVQTRTESKKPLAPCQCGGERYYSKKWYIYLTIDGRKYDRVQSGGSTLKDDACIEEGEIKKQRSMGTGEKIFSGKMTVQQAYDNVFEAYLNKAVKDNMLAPTTASNYKISFKNHLIRHLGRLTLAQIDHITLQDYIDTRTDEDSEPALGTIYNELVALRVLFKALISKRMYRDNPVAGFQVRTLATTRTKVLTAEETVRLLEECRKISPALELIVKIALFTGLRKTGVLGLKWEHINFTTNTITRTVKHRRREGPKVIEIPINSAFRAELIRWRDRGGVTRRFGLLFVGKKAGKQILSLEKIGFNKAMARAGITDFVYHGLRHTFITKLIESGQTLAVVGAIVGHTSTYMTSRYFHLTDKKAKEALHDFDITGSGQ
jgi:integrase